MVFKSKLWVESQREIYDNNSSIVAGIVCIGGYLFALIALPPLEVALFLWALCCIIDDIGWIIVYKRNREVLIVDKEEVGETNTKEIKSDEII